MTENELARVVERDVRDRAERLRLACQDAEALSDLWEGNGHSPETEAHLRGLSARCLARLVNESAELWVLEARLSPGGELDRLSQSWRERSDEAGAELTNAIPFGPQK